MSFFECEGITMILHFKSLVVYIEVLIMIEIIWYISTHFYELSWNAFLFYLPSQNCRIGI